MAAASRIRFYEASGLLQPAQRQANGYREYAPDIVDPAGDHPARAMRRVLLGGDPGDPAARSGQLAARRLLQALQGKIDEIEVLEQRLAQSKRHLSALMDEIGSQQPR